MIAEYEAADRAASLDAPNIYGLSLKHKHLPEMKAVCGLSAAPIFCPIVADYYSGMQTTIPLRMELLKADPAAIAAAMEEAVPAVDPGGYNQALMDLGATVCLPNGQPLCESCPLRDLCRARALGIQESLPLREKKAARRREALTVFVLLREGKVALRQRKDTGLLAGLWEFPNVPEALDEGGAADMLAEWGLSPLNWRERRTARHLFTHVEWAMTGYTVQVRGEDNQGFTWADLAMLSELAVPSAFAKYLAAAREALAPRIY
mgnify:CR=1 FL=1